MTKPKTDILKETRTEYAVVIDEYLPRFVEKVDCRLNDGWQMHGHTIPVGYKDGLVEFMQAFTREVEV